VIVEVEAVSTIETSKLKNRSGRRNGSSRSNKRRKSRKRRRKENKIKIGSFGMRLTWSLRMAVGYLIFELICSLSV
jgi:hypothetical protein